MWAVYTLYIVICMYMYSCIQWSGTLELYFYIWLVAMYIPCTDSENIFILLVTNYGHSYTYFTYTCMCACVNCAYMGVHKHVVMLYICVHSYIIISMYSTRYHLRRLGYLKAASTGYWHTVGTLKVFSSYGFSTLIILLY